uniref:Solute carrier family 47 member 1 n=1 Tax=Lynx canadensis TaxID=61383 RepID=A0A667HAQ1_LYNCA
MAGVGTGPVRKHGVSCLSPPGILGMVELGAQSVVYEVTVILYMIPSGFSVATSIRVGNALGAGDIEQAKKSSTVALLVTGVFAITFCVLLLIFKDLVGYIFTSDREIVALVAEVIPICAVSHVFEGLACTSGGILRGSGNQKAGAMVNAVGYYVVGLPVGISLMFLARLKVLAVVPRNQRRVLRRAVVQRDETPLDLQMSQDARMTGRQLVLWRGLLLLGVISILLLGILLRVYIRVEG